MARPRKYYVLLPLVGSPHIIEGSIAARKAGANGLSFKSRLAAEEYAAWWDHERHDELISERYVRKSHRAQRTSYYRPGAAEPYLSYGDPPPRYPWQT